MNSKGGLVRGSGSTRMPSPEGGVALDLKPQRAVAQPLDGKQRKPRQEGGRSAGERQDALTQTRKLTERTTIHLKPRYQRRVLFSTTSARGSPAMTARDVVDDRPNVIGRQPIAAHHEMDDGIGHHLFER
jgi:hypothetical protein